MRNTLLGIVVLALAAGGWLASRSPDTAPLDSLVGPSTVTQDPVERTDLAELSDVVAGDGGRTEPAPTSAIDEAAEGGPVPLAQALDGGPLIGLEGHLTARPDGPPFDLRELQQISARVTLGKTELLLPIPVRNGKLRLEFVRREDGRWALPNGTRPLPEEFDGGTVELMAPKLKKSVGAVAFVDRSKPDHPLTQRRSFKFGQRNVLVELHAPPIVRLVAIDAVSQQPLRGIEVRRLKSRGHGQLRTSQPTFGRVKRLGPDGVIPAERSWADFRTIELQARVKGYAPAMFTTSFAKGGDVRLEMWPAAEFLVEATGDIPKGAYIRLLTPGTGETAWENGPTGDLRDGQPARFDRLAPGPVLVCLHCRHETEPDAPEGLYPIDVLAIEEAHVRSGESTRVTLHYHPTAEAQRAPFHGAFLLPKPWPALDTIQVTLHARQGQMEEPRYVSAKLDPATAEQNPRVYRFHAGDLSVGDYVAVLKSPHFSTRLFIPPGGLKDWSHQVGRPRNYRIRVLNKKEERATDVESVSVTSTHFFQPQAVTERDGEGDFVFVSAESVLSVHVRTGEGTLSHTVQSAAPQPTVISFDTVMMLDASARPSSGVIR